MHEANDMDYRHGGRSMHPNAPAGTDSMAQTDESYDFMPENGETP